MFRWILLLFVLIPVLELTLLIQVGTEIGVINTLLLILFTAIAGVSLARWQGLQVFFKIQQSLAQGVFPTSEMVDGLMILCAAAVLLTPGLITDAMAFLILFPVSRRAIKRWLFSRFKEHYQDKGTITVNTIDYDDWR